ncbi:MAG: hypothetical protein ACYC9O_06675 [Candidatus Latescibacterota bacterium]
MEAVPIGKGLYRIIVRSRAKRERLALIPEVQIEGIRVIFPEWMYGSIKRLIQVQPKRKSSLPEQTDIFDE